MKYRQIDKITSLLPGKKLTAERTLRADEEFLRDHFPRFPVMPGVLMLEAMTQASAWLIRVTDDFSHSIVTLQEARNIRYGNFVQPGDALKLEAEILSHNERTTKLKASGSTERGSAVSARLVLERYDLSETDPSRADIDVDLKLEMRKVFARVDHSGTAKEPV